MEKEETVIDLEKGSDGVYREAHSSKVVKTKKRKNPIAKKKNVDLGAVNVGPFSTNISVNPDAVPIPVIVGVVAAGFLISFLSGKNNVR
jgi:hypothetical protein